MSSSDPFQSIPSSPFLLVLVPFLTPLEILSLRLTCRSTHEMLHSSPDSEVLWKLLLKTNFGICEDWTRTLRIAPLSTGIPSIFGVPPAIQQVPSAFEAWKHWVKCSGRFYSGLSDIQDKSPLLNAPYFLRAAALWSKLSVWMDTSGSHGSRVKALHSSGHGLLYQDWSEVRDRPCIEACQALYAFCRGPEAFQVMTQENFETVFDGLLGGYHAYDFYSCTHLIRPRLTPSDKVIIAMDPLAMHSGARKVFCVNGMTGSLELDAGGNAATTRPAIRGDVLEQRSSAQGQDAVLIWMEEYANRLSNGQIGVGLMGSTPHDHNAITLYPRIPTELASSPVVTEGVQPVSRAVTRGVEVVASSVYVPQTGAINNLGFIYSIRIRLLTPDDKDYVSAADRGFVTCQLHSRHWRISNHDTKHVEAVDGNGVVGMYPLLREGGYTDGEDSFDGVFSYTSCTSPMQGSFSGHLQFVPGSLDSPAGSAFTVELRPFALDNNPAFLY